MRLEWTRRDFLQAGLALAGSAALSACRFRGSAPPPLPASLPEITPWPEANAILAATERPRIRDAEFLVSARGDGKIDDSDAFAAVIAECHAAGGGRVRVPPGRFLVGAIRLLDGVELHLDAGATLSFSEDPRRFPTVLTRYEGIECMNRSPMIYAYGARDIAITGAGTLDASATAAWNCGDDREGVLEPLLSRPSWQRDVVGRLRSSFVEPYGCERVLIEGVTLIGSPFWQLHPTLCRHVIVERVTTTVAGHNSDGCDPESCDHVVVRESTLGSGDDNLAIKSGRDGDGRRLGVPCRNLVIMNCQAEGAYAFLACGSEQSGGIENVYAFNNWSYGQGVGQALRIKTNTRRGGFTRNLRLDGFRGAVFAQAVVEITMNYEGQQGDALPAVEDVELRNIAAANAPRALDLTGLSQAPLTSLRVCDSRFEGMAEANRVENVRALVLDNVTINGARA